MVQNVESRIRPVAEGDEKKISFWLSYDFGLKADYSSLYEWLDKFNAKECGYNLAYVEFVTEHTVNDFNEFTGLIYSEIEASVKIGPNDRIYVILAPKGQGAVGRFIIGKRKRAVWEGYSRESEVDVATDKS